MIKSFIYKKFPKQFGKFLYLKSLIEFPIKYKKLNEGKTVYFGSKEQDKWVIKEIFNFKKKGYFVDLAATDGLHENNTLLMEKKFAWDGICIEPNDFFFKKLKLNRSCVCHNACVDEDEREVEFVENGGIGGIIGDEYDNNLNKRKNLISNFKKKNLIKKIKTTTLTKILKKFKAPKIIDYLSLDVEGAEEKVLKNFPFDEYKFLTMTIERPTPKLNELLINKEYVFVKNHKVDTFYIHKSIKDKVNVRIENFEQLPGKSW